MFLFILLGLATNIAGERSVTVEEDGRVVLSDNSVNKRQVCVAYNKTIAVKDDRLATLLCKQTDKGDVGLMFELGGDNTLKTVTHLMYPLYESKEFKEGDEVEGCGKSGVMGVKCAQADKVKLSCNNTIVNKFIRKECVVHGESVYKCGESDQYYRVNTTRTDYCFFTNICSDPEEMQYQSCSCAGVKIQDGMCKSMVCEQLEQGTKYYRSIATRRICDGINHCVDKSDESSCNYTQLKGRHCNTREGRENWVPQVYMCDSDNDCILGEDELDCGFDDTEFGMHCNSTNNTRAWVSNKQLCNNFTFCSDARDEKDDICSEKEKIMYNCPNMDRTTNISVTKNDTCQRPRSYSTTISSTTKTGCYGFLDQTNCSSMHVLNCTVKGYRNTRVRDRWLCNNNPICDDKSDELCHSFSEHCKVHKYQQCDNYPDCAGNEDETGCQDFIEPNTTCQRYLTRNHTAELPLLKAWICDDVRDCVNGLDENRTYWNCSQGLKCPDNSSIFVKIESVCDDVEDCIGAEAALCRVTRDNPHTQLHTSHVVHDAKADITYHFKYPCLPGLMKDNDNVTSKSKCIEKNTVTKNLYEKSESIRLFEWNPCVGELGSVTDSLFKFAVQCRNETEEKLSSNCHSPNEIFSKTMGSAFLHKFLLLKDHVLSEDLYICNNSKCINSGLVCNFVDDCGDASDEDNCAHTHYCNPETPTVSPRFIPKYKVCDQVYDCTDNSDECQYECGSHRILQNCFVRTMSIVIGLSAVVLNMYTIARGYISFREASSVSLRVNHFLVCLIGAGDFNTGLYLVILFSYDQYYAHDFCVKKFEWLTCRTCSFLGIISTFGSTLSIFVMVLLASFRAFSASGIPERFNKTIIERLLFAMGTFSIFAALTIASVPVFPSLEDYFTNGQYYKANPLFPKFADMQAHVNLVNKYKNISGDLTDTPETWSYLLNFTLHIFENVETNKNLQPQSHTFYGNDAVCLFKYLVKQSDPQQQYATAITSTNFFCFIIITLCYSYVILKLKQVGESTGIVMGKEQREKQRKIQAKIIIITLTDFIAWVPFSIICWLYTNGVQMDEQSAYQLSAAFALPLNSVINPMIYNELPVTVYNVILSVMSVKLNSDNKATRTTSITVNENVVDNIQLDSITTAPLAMTSANQSP